MQIKELMTREVDLIEPTTMINVACQLMKKEDVGALPISKDDKLVGMITDRDVVVRAIAEGKDPASTHVSEAMSNEVLYCFDDQTVEEVAANMGDNQVRRLPVVNRDKELVGIVSLGDLSNADAKAETGAALGRIAQSAY